MNTTAPTQNRFLLWFSRLRDQKGNTIAYVAMLLIIFGVIGVVMTSLLTSSVVSTTTPNHSRRALYMTEAGMRFGLSELRNAEDWLNRIQELNTTTYTVSAGETFTLNIFGPWYQADTYQSRTTGGTLTLNVPEGDMPTEYNFDTNSPHLSIINYNYTGNSIPDESVAQIDGFNRVDAHTVEFDVRDPIIVDNHDLVCMAVNIDAETLNQMPIDPRDSIYVAEQARHVSPSMTEPLKLSATYIFMMSLFMTAATTA